ncbi:MAG: DUF1565 domain-containing protein [Desulfatiglandaceae bacterium]
MKKAALIFMLILFILVPATPLLAADRLVPSSYPTIQQAIDAAQEGDVVKVAKGTYPENIVMKEGLTLQGGYSADFSARDISLYVTTIDGGQNGSVIRFESITSAAIDGFTIVNGESDLGGGINCVMANPSIVNNTIKGNQATIDGGGIRCYRSNPEIILNVITDNKAKNGGGILCFESDPPILHNTMTGNQASGHGGGIVCYRQSDAIISANTIAANEAGIMGGGIFSYESSPEISNNILSGNHAFVYGGAVFCDRSSPVIKNCAIVRNMAMGSGTVYAFLSSSPQISNTVFWQNSNDLVFDFVSSPSVTYTDIADARFWDHNGNMSADPLFVDIEAGDYRLSSDSPCINAGDPSTDQRDPDGSRNDMGAFGGPGAVLWGENIPMIPVPYNETSHWEDLGLYGGQIRSLAIDPVDSARIFAASYMGDGLFVTGNGGATWLSIEGFRNEDCYWVGIDPEYPDRVWVTYNYFVALSVDGGTSWSRWRLPEDRFAFSGAIDPTDSNTVYVGAGGRGSYNKNGTIFKTEDGGSTWTQTGLAADECVNFLAINPSNHQEVWALTGYNEPGSVYRSSDGGITWEKVDIGYSDKDVYNIIIDPEKSLILYISGEFGVIKTLDGGRTWKDLGIAEACNGLAMDPGNSDIIYASTYMSDNNYFYKSLDGGATWDIYPIGSHAFGCLAVDPRNSSILYGGDHNLGVFKSSDTGATWGASNQGIRASIVWDSTVDPNDRDILLSGTVGGLFKREPHGEWKRLSYEVAYCVTYDPQDSNTIYVGHDWSLARTTDYGKTWEKTDVSSSSDGHEVSSIAVDPQNSDALFVGVSYSGKRGEIYKSSDAGKTLKLKQVFDVPVNVVKVDRADSRVIYAGTGMFYASSYNEQGGIYKSTDGGAIWTGPLLKDVVVNSIEIDPTNSNVLYAGCGSGGDSYPGLFKSVDGGLTWEKKAFDPCAVTELKINPNSTHILYAATYRKGVYMSIDSGENWTNIGLSDYKMVDLSFSPGPATPSFRSYGQSESTRSLYAGTNSGLSAFTGSSISGWIYESTGTAKIYPAQVWLDAGQAQVDADVFETGAYLILYPPVGCNYNIFCTAQGHSQGMGSGIDVSAMSDVNYDFYLSPTAVPDASTLTVAVSGTTVTISWTRVSGATGYRLNYAPSPYTGPDTIRSIDMGNQIEVSFDLWKGASFYVAATAYNSVGSSGYSNIEHFVIP